MHLHLVIMYIVSIDYTVDKPLKQLKENTAMTKINVVDKSVASKVVVRVGK